jgi:preprotein translocase subunit SecG
MISGMGGLGGQMTNLIGVRQSRNVLQNLTIGFAVFLVVAAIIVNKFFMETGGTTEARSAVEGAAVPNVERTTPPPATPAPGQQPAQP